MACIVKISLLFTLITATLAQSVDFTVAQGAIGADVVLATISRIEDEGIFSTDRRMLRRVAFVETRDGQNLSSSGGGIWNVRQSDFVRTMSSTQTILASVSLLLQRVNLNPTFQITTWSSVRYSNLDIPLLSALAARLVIELANAAIPTASNITGQALFWMVYYNPDGDVDTFREDVEQLIQDEGTIRVNTYMYSTIMNIAIHSSSLHSQFRHHIRS